MPGGGARQGPVMQALAGLEQIRQRQCQMGNQLACQELPRYPGYRQQVAQLDQGCQSGDSRACGEFDTAARRFFTAYQESAAVMQAGDAATAQMNGWRDQMNRNAAASMANLNARAAAGQRAHEARQQMYDGMNRSWAQQQAMSDRAQGRRIDTIYEGTTMDGGGVQSRIGYGSTGYTDGRGNVIAVPNGSAPPDGWQRMNDTYRPR
jgi:hypothetical protein